MQKLRDQTWQEHVQKIANLKDGTSLFTRSFRLFGYLERHWDEKFVGPFLCHGTTRQKKSQISPNWNGLVFTLLTDFCISAMSRGITSFMLSEHLSAHLTRVYFQMSWENDSIGNWWTICTIFSVSNGYTAVLSIRSIYFMSCLSVESSTNY